MFLIVNCSRTDLRHSTCRGALSCESAPATSEGDGGAATLRTGHSLRFHLRAGLGRDARQHRWSGGLADGSGLAEAVPLGERSGFSYCVCCRLTSLIFLPTHACGVCRCPIFSTEATGGEAG